MIHRFKLHGMYFSDKFAQKFTEIAHLHKTACAKIQDNFPFIHKLLILCLLESRHSQVSKTAFILKFGPPVAKKINFQF